MVKGLSSSAKGNVIWELLFQVILLTVVFIFFSFDKNSPQIELYQFVFFANFVVAAMIINYLLLPHLFYKRRYILFLLSFLTVTALVILTEELVLEQIYFPDTRGRRFSGFFYGLLDVLPVITILSGMKFAWDLIQKQREVEDLKATMQESELSFLKSQINPHFLFNNLNNLYSYALENSPRTPDIILELSSVLRYMLYECREKYVSLGKELRQLEKYVRLSELQIEERGEVTFSAPEAVGNYKIAPLILMVFVENAFKHSQASQSEGIRINIAIYLQHTSELVFDCVNSYLSEKNSKQLPKGIGLLNVRKRLELLYPGKYQLKINDDGQNYHVHLLLTLDS